MRFLSLIRLGGWLPEFSEAQVKNEPMLFNCDADFAREMGGPITRSFLDALDPEYLRGVFDTRVHMLMPGWYPCIPGWHHDDVPRSTSNGQPNYQKPEYFSRHACALVNADVAPTEFLAGTIDVPGPDYAGVIYRQWDDYLEAGGKLQGAVVPARDRRLIYFDADTFHRGVQAVRSGWRWFGRVSIDTDRKPTNEIRRQVQVYMGIVNAGW